MARELQKYIYVNCSSDDEKLKSEIFKSVLNSTNTSSSSSQSQSDQTKPPKRVEDDNYANKSGNALSYKSTEQSKKGLTDVDKENLEASIDSIPPEVDTFKSQPLNIKESHHGPSVDNDTYNLNKVL